MHELSIIHSIMDTVSEELARRGNRHAVESITLKIGQLAGVETDSISFLWSAAVERSPLEQAELTIHHIPGKARCMECQISFPVTQFYDPCPQCQSHFIEILEGEELQIESFVLTDAPNLPSPINNGVHETSI